VTDTVFVTGLAVHAYHGVMDHEATVGQTFRLDLVLSRFPQVSRVQVTVHKPHAPIAATFADVGVTIIRGRQDRG
jgi:dihydroneopterin aldolase